MREKLIRKILGIKTRFLTFFRKKIEVPDMFQLEIIKKRMS